MTRLYKNTSTILHTPGMFREYLRWNLHWIGINPFIQIGNHLIRGFASFSEFWGTKKNLPVMDELLYFNKAIHQDSIIFDVGANVGVYTIIFSDLAKEGKVYAFEPAQTTYTALVKNVNTNNLQNVRHYQLALGDQTGTTDFVFNPRSLATNHLGSKTLLAGDRLERVNIMTLDDFCHTFNIDYINFLKIDVEGAEVNVLQGASNLLKEHKIGAIFLEMCPQNLSHFNNLPGDIFKKLNFYLYTLYSLTPEGDIGLKPSQDDFSLDSYKNIVALPN